MENIYEILPDTWENLNGNKCNLISILKDRGETLVVFSEELNENQIGYSLDFLEEIQKEIQK